MTYRVVCFALSLGLLMTGSALGDDFRCSEGQLPSPGQDGVWRLFKPMPVQEDLPQVSRPRRYHEPWKRIFYSAPSQTPSIEAFGPPSGGAKDHSRFFTDEDTLPLGGAAERQACELFRSATVAVYSTAAADDRFASKETLTRGMSELEEELESVTGQLSRARREIADLTRRLQRLEAAQAEDAGR